MLREKETGQCVLGVHVCVSVCRTTSELGPKKGRMTNEAVRNRRRCRLLEVQKK